MYVEPFERIEPNREVTGVRVAVLDGSCSEVRTVLEPRLNTYRGTSQPIGTPDVWTGLVDDVYVGIAGGTTSVIDLNVFVFPFQWLLWVGGLVIVAGGVLALARKPLARSEASDSTSPMTATEVR